MLYLFLGKGPLIKKDPCAFPKMLHMHFRVKSLPMRIPPTSLLCASLTSDCCYVFEQHFFNVFIYLFFYPQSCPPPCRWKATWRNRSTCGRISHPTSWQRRPSMLQWQHSNRTVRSVRSSVLMQRYSHKLQHTHIRFSELELVVIWSSSHKICSIVCISSAVLAQVMLSSSSLG